MHRYPQDFRHALRILRNQPGFTAVAVLTLALGMGASTAIFSVLDAVILRPLPYGAPDRLVLVKEWIPKAIPDPIPVCAPDVVQFQRENQSFESLAAFWGGQFDLSGGTEPLRVNVARVNANLFSLLGVQPSLGRAFSSEEDRPGHMVTLLSYGLWQRQFGGDPNIVGRSVTLNRQPYAVVGVMPRSFVFPLPGMSQGDASDLFVPMAFTPGELAEAGDNFNYSVVGRLKPGVSLALANADLAAIAHRILETYPVQFRADINLTAIALPLADQVVGKARTMLLLLFGAVAFVLLISCINVTNLLLTRANDRQREIALRLALGASRMRLLHQLLAETMLLTLASASLGLALARSITSALLALMPAEIPRVHTLDLNPSVVGFAGGLAGLTGLFFGVVPVLAASRTNVNRTLKEGGRSGLPGREHNRIRSALVVVEVALAMVLLVGAGLLLRSFQRVLETDPGFQPEHVLTASLSLPDQQYKQDAQVRSFYQRLMERLRQMPGVGIAGGSTDLPLQAGWNHIFTAEGYQSAPGASLNLANHSVILGQYLETMGVPLLRGRYFTEQDNGESTHVLMVSESLAKRYWPNGDAIGKRLKWGPPESKDAWLTIVGIVGDVKQGTLETETTPHTYEPFLQNTVRTLNVAMRAAGGPATLASALRTTVWTIDSQLAVAKMQTMDQVISESTTPRRFNLFLLAGFAGLALILSATGIYAVIAYSVGRRVHEIGVRMALGAQRADVMRLVVGQGLVLLGIGLVAGIAGALVLTRSLASFLYGVRPADPVTFAFVVVILAGVALLASYIPARRATKVDPMVALRYE
jgi:predicted permease